MQFVFRFAFLVARSVAIHEVQYLLGFDWSSFLIGGAL